MFRCATSARGDAQRFADCLHDNLTPSLCNTVVTTAGKLNLIKCKGDTAFSRLVMASEGCKCYNTLGRSQLCCVSRARGLLRAHREQFAGAM